MLFRSKINLLRIEARIDTLREVLMLPKFLKEQLRQALKTLVRTSALPLPTDWH